MKKSQIWKKPLTLPEGGVVTGVENSGILHVGIDPNGVPCVWFWAPEEEASVVSEVVLFGTGESMEPESVDRYIGSFVWRMLVLHAFEREHHEA